jgi:hypothetical protein
MFKISPLSNHPVIGLYFDRSLLCSPETALLQQRSDSSLNKNEHRHPSLMNIQIFLKVVNFEHCLVQFIGTHHLFFLLSLLLFDHFCKFTISFLGTPSFLNFGDSLIKSDANKSEV